MRRSEVSFTLVELLVVMAILAILAGIVAVGTAGPRLEAKVTDQKAMLRQVHFAWSLYREQSEQAAPYDLPGVLHVMQTMKRVGHFHGIRQEHLLSRCGQHPRARQHTLIWLYGERGDTMFADYYERLGERTMLAATHECNPPEVAVEAQFTTKRGIGIQLDGTLVDRRNRGHVSDMRFWFDDTRPFP